jgi:hypothetical protein
MVDAFAKNNVATDRLPPPAIHKVNHAAFLAHVCAIGDNSGTLALRTIGIVTDEYHATRPPIVVSDTPYVLLCVHLATLAASKRVAFYRCVVDTWH